MTECGEGHYPQGVFQPFGEEEKQAHVLREDKMKEGNWLVTYGCCPWRSGRGHLFWEDMRMGRDDIPGLDETTSTSVGSLLPKRGKDLGHDDFDFWCRPFSEEDVEGVGSLLPPGGIPGVPPEDMRMGGDDIPGLDETTSTSVGSLLPKRGKDLGHDDFDFWCRPFSEEDVGGEREIVKVISLAVMFPGDIEPNVKFVYLLALNGQVARVKTWLATLPRGSNVSFEFSLSSGSSNTSSNSDVVEIFPLTKTLMSRSREEEYDPPIMVEEVWRNEPEVDVGSELWWCWEQQLVSLEKKEKGVSDGSTEGRRCSDREEEEDCYGNPMVVKTLVVPEAIVVPMRGQLLTEYALMLGALEESPDPMLQSTGGGGLSSSPTFGTRAPDVVACACNRDEITSKDKELFEENRRVSTNDLEIFEANGRITSMAKEIEALRQ
ncbi:hypothetical protein V6N11_002142 [Hibiscus sabdariffa]|uniref:Uncharacterized protein n=1 Tax=Hibiscus sabdariffa TaxID=183260 RepID=A0ABR2QUY3_9ROSI